MMPSRRPTPFRHNEETHATTSSKDYDDDPIILLKHTNNNRRGISHSTQQQYPYHPGNNNNTIRAYKRSKENNTSEPPSIATSSSSSSLSSDSSTLATIAAARKVPSKQVLSRSSLDGNHVYPNEHPHHLSGSRAPPLLRASIQPRRGMVAASPARPLPNTPPTTLAIAHRPPAILSPPEIHRMTVHPGLSFPLWRSLDDNHCHHRLPSQHHLQQQHLHHDSQTRYPSSNPNWNYSRYEQGASNPFSGHFCYSQHPFGRVPLGPFILYNYRCEPEVIGHPSLRVYKLQLPSRCIHLLDQIVAGCEAFACGRKTGWSTNLYSLTKQDLALVDVPGMLELAKPITEYMSHCICELYHADSVQVDRNQPHVLKYSEDHTGVELHHDRCDVTANLMMSRSHTYVGGGTFIPDANKIVRLKYGEFLLHPGQLVHGGMDITNGTRYLMVLFAHLKK